MNVLVPSAMNRPDKIAMSITSSMDVMVPSAINRPDKTAMSVTSSMDGTED
jgi:hypothetical protein